jgi:hypothetical protein
LHVLLSAIGLWQSLPVGQRLRRNRGELRQKTSKVSEAD